jgi:hypothetical protein
MINTHERAAWKALIELGAAQIELGGKPALDLSTIRTRNKGAAVRFVDAVVNVAGRSGAVRRHMDRAGRLIYVVRDTDTPETRA